MAPRRLMVPSGSGRLVTARTMPSRRAFLRGMGMAAFSGAVLAACGTPGTRSQAGAGEDLSEEEKVLAFSNWPLYIDYSEDESTRPTLERFMEETGIDVTYTEEINDNAEFFGKIQNQLNNGEPTGRDLIVITDTWAAKMVSYGWMQELDWDNLPNVEANLLDSLRSPAFDPERTYSVPWQSGLTGIAYNAAEIGEVRTIDELLTRADLKGRVTLLSELGDAMGLVLLSMGKDPGDFTDADFEAAIEKVQGAVDSGQVRAFTGNEYAQDLAQGNVVACMAWSGDVIQLQLENPDIRFVTPEEGLILWSDNMMVPNGATHKTNAERLMNYYYDPAVAAEVAAWVNYICPVQGAQEAMRDIDPELADNPLIFPDDTIQAAAHSFKGLDEETERRYNELFQQVIGA